MRSFVLASFLLSCIASLAISQTKSTEVREKRTEEAQPVDKEKEKEKKEEHGMQYRAIGPFRGGRSLTASGVPGDPNTWYFGSTGGGIWKTTDAAITWKPIFDHEKSSSIGSLAVAPSDPNVIYAGTGEGCIRGNLAQGDALAHVRRSGLPATALLTFCKLLTSEQFHGDAARPPRYVILT